MPRNRSVYEFYSTKQRISDLKNLVKIQSSAGNAEHSEYMRGLANGLILALTLMTEPYGTEPAFIKALNESSHE